MITHVIHPSPVGPLTLVGVDGALAGLFMDDQRHRPNPTAFGTRDDSSLRDVRRQLDEYFEGSRRHFDLPLVLQGSAFQRRVWEGLRQIPYGTTISYGELARRIDNPAASRAVGLANGRNPVGIIVPCHRVIGAGGALTGYGGGLDRKRWLLDHEGVGAAAPVPR